MAADAAILRVGLPVTRGGVDECLIFFAASRAAVPDDVVLDHGRGVKDNTKGRKTPRFMYILFNKPFGILCQFRGTSGHDTLARFGPFPRDVYPVGRLDRDSEGLMLLTNDGLLKHRLTDPAFGHPRTYLVQVERVPSPDALRKLRNGVMIENRKTLPAEVDALAADPDLPPRPVPIRYRKSVPTSWLRFTIREGRNRQIRKMTAAVGHPTLRIVRIAIGPLSIDGLRPGEHRPLAPEEITRLRTCVDTRGKTASRTAS